MGRSRRKSLSALRTYRRALRLEPLEDRRLLAVVTVTTIDDSIDPGDGVTSLREAIAATNALPGEDKINFDPSLTIGGPATILLTHGELVITDSLKVNGPGAYLLTIDASGNDPTPNSTLNDGNTANDGDGSRVLSIDDGTVALLDVEINGLRLTGGDSPLGGGGISTRENLVVRECIVEGNTSKTEGGGIYSVNTGSLLPLFSLTVSDSLILGNAAGNEGGGIRKVIGSLTVERTVVDGNQAGSVGGGISAANELVQVQIRDSLVRGNRITSTNSGFGGGGIFLYDAKATITNTSVVQNTSRQGTGIYSAGSGTGSTGTPSTAIVNSTISGNIASGPSFDGAAVYARNTGSISYSTIANNTGAGNSSPWTGISTLVIGNTTSNSINSGGFCLVNASSIGIIGPLFGSGDPLFLDGERMPIHSLLPGSPAIDAGKSTSVAGVAGVPLLDQRAAPRVANGDGVGGARIDIGAYERQPDEVLTFVVDTLADENGDGYSPGSRSLREAILLANAHRGPDTITFDPTLTASGPGTISLKYGEILITDALSITGPGSSLLKIDAQQQSRIFNIDDPSVTNPSFDALISGLTVANGKTTGNNTSSSSRFLNSGGAIRSYVSIGGSSGTLALNDVNAIDSGTTGNSASGGGIFALGALTLSHSLVSGNSTAGIASYGGGIASHASVTLTDSVVDHNLVTGDYGMNNVRGYNTGASGGGIWSTGLVTLTRTTVANNSTTHVTTIIPIPLRTGGGGVFSQSAGLTATDSVIRGNNSASDGGGIRAGGGVITNCTITNNTAGGSGGGIASLGTMNVIACTLANNTATGPGGGIYAQGPSSTISDSTISGNSTTGMHADGGGISGRQVNVLFSTITDNHTLGAYADGGGIAATTNVIGRNSIVAGNSAAGMGQDIFGTGGLFFSLVGNNDGASGGFATEAPVGSPNAQGTLIGGAINGLIDPKLGPLVNNGGPTQTRALLSSSPAINAGDPAAAAGVSGVPVFDERGTPWDRVVDGRIDMGAVEWHPNPLPGDYNFNGAVDSADYAIWQDTVGATTDLRADGSGPTAGVPDGVVDALDYQFWMTQFGNVLSAGGGGIANEQTTVPANAKRASVEPTDQALALFAEPIDSTRLQSNISVLSRTNAQDTRATTSTNALLAWVTSATTKRGRKPGEEKSLSDESSHAEPAVDLVFETLTLSPPRNTRHAAAAT